MVTYQLHTVPSPVVNVSILDLDVQTVRYSGNTSPVLMCSAQLSSSIDIPVDINFWWFGPNGAILNITLESGISTSMHEWNSSIVVTSANTSDSGEYTCLVGISPSYISTFIIPSQMESETISLTIGELLNISLNIN